MPFSGSSMSFACTCFKRQKVTTLARTKLTTYESIGPRTARQDRSLHLALNKRCSDRAKLQLKQASTVSRPWPIVNRTKFLPPNHGRSSSTLPDSSTEHLEVSKPTATTSKPPKTGKKLTMTPPAASQVAFVAIGSNLGDRLANIENALASMRREGLKIVQTGNLYETKAMYYEAQADFLNTAVQVRTTLRPLELLHLLQKIELEHGRVREIEKGPRTLDLDILLYGNMKVSLPQLEVPHPRLTEREFALAPLADMDPGRPLKDANGKKAATSIFSKQARESGQVAVPCVPLLPGPHEPMFSSTLVVPESRTQIMSILNITPDSFSDGGKLNPSDTESLIATAKKHVAAGATILDVGGQSTRPGADLISEEEELKRVLPALQALRTIPEVQAGKVAVSIDTFYASVARACAQESLIDIINDVTGGMHDAQMLSVAAEFRKTIVLMHMRGTPKTMTQHTNYDEQGGVVKGVAAELGQRVRAAFQAGVPRWRIILDPGLGFAKDLEGNLKLLAAGPRALASQSRNFLFKLPWLVGPSRKGFVGKVTGTTTPQDRVWGTAACVTAAIETGVDIVRVHDVEEMAGVVKMANALYRDIRLSKQQSGGEKTQEMSPGSSDDLARVLDTTT